jgi:hypothetical protein
MKLWVALKLWLALAGCVIGCEEAAPPLLDLGSDGGPPALAASGRLDLRSYYVTNRSATCFLYWREGATTSVETEVPCPREIDDGERLHYTGRTCMRESSDAARNLPVRCPKQISHALRDEKAGKGELKLPAAGSAEKRRR